MKLLILFCLLVLSPAAYAADPGITREVLPNGVTLLVHSSSASNVVGMEMISRVGTRFESPGKAGLAALTLQAALAGAGQRTGADIREWFEDRGSALNVHTHPDYSEIGAAVIAPDFPEMARIMASIAAHATLSPESIRSEQQAVVQGLNTVDSDAEAAAYRSLRTLLADSTAYGRSEAGLAGTVSTLTPEDVTRCYHQMFAPGEMIVSVSGNVKGDEAVKLLKGLFGDMPGAARAVSPRPIRTAVREPSSMVLGGSSDAAWIMVGYLTPGVKDPDYAALTVLNAIIGGSNSGVLTSHFRDQSGVYDSGTFIQPFATQTHIVGYVRADPLLWDERAQKSRPLIDQLQKELLAIFAGIRDHGVSDDQVQVARQYVLGQYLQSHEHNRNYAGYIGWYEAIGLGAGFDEQFTQAIRKVTAGDVNRLARTYFAQSLEATVVMFPLPPVEE